MRLQDEDDGEIMEFNSGLPIDRQQALKMFDTLSRHVNLKCTVGFSRKDMRTVFIQIKIGNRLEVLEAWGELPDLSSHVQKLLDRISELPEYKLFLLEHRLEGL